MKKLMFVISLNLLIIFAIACEKQIDKGPEFCWKCRWEFIKPNSYRSTVTDVCGMSEERIRQFEKDNTTIYPDSSVNKMTCWKKGDSPI